jgi:hypothetical protein
MEARKKVGGQGKDKVGRFNKILLMCGINGNRGQNLRDQ